MINLIKLCKISETVLSIIGSYRLVNEEANERREWAVFFDIIKASCPSAFIKQIESPTSQLINQCPEMFRHPPPTAKLEFPCWTRVQVEFNVSEQRLWKNLIRVARKIDEHAVEFPHNKGTFSAWGKCAPNKTRNGVESSSWIFNFNSTRCIFTCL